MKNTIQLILPYRWLIIAEGYLFLISVLILTTVYYFLYPSLFFSAEMWAEVGTNFLYHALYSDLSENILAKDYTYLPWIQRIISVLIIDFFGIKPEYFPLATQILTQVFIAVLASSINFKMFRSIIASDSLRFFLGLAIGLAPDYEQHSLINFIYFAAVPLLLFSFVNKKDLSRLTYISLTILSFFVVMSKGIMIVFIVIYLPMLAYFSVQKNYREILFFAIGLLAILIQVTVMKSSDQTSMVLTAETFTTLIQSTGYTYLRLITTTLFGPSAKDIFETFGYSFPLVLLFAFIILLLKVKERSEFSNLFLFLGFTQIFILIHIALMNLTVLNGQVINYDDFTPYSFHRFYFLPKVLMFLSVCLLIYNHIKNGIVTILLLSTLGLLFSIIPATRFQDPFASSLASFSQWRTFASLLQRDEYCIPLNPFPWSMGYNCATVYQDAIPRTRKEIVLDPKHSVSAIVLIKPKFLPYGYEPMLLLLDVNNAEIGKAKRMTPINSDFVYYKFEPDQAIGKQPHKIVFVSEDHQKTTIHSGLVIYGK